MPAVGKKINIFIPYVVDVDRFYAQLVHKNCKSATDLTAHQIFEKINAPEKITKFKKFLHPPGECELVFAMFNGEWYRAKILKKFSDIQYRVSISRCVDTFKSHCLLSSRSFTLITATVRT